MLGLTTSVAWMDTSLLRGVADDRRWRTRATVRSRRLRGTGPAVLLRADLRRLARRPDRVVGWAALAVVPYVVAAVADPIWVAVAQVLAGALAVEPAHRRAAHGRPTSPGCAGCCGLADRQPAVLHTLLPGGRRSALGRRRRRPRWSAAGDPRWPARRRPASRRSGRARPRRSARWPPRSGPRPGRR